MFIISFFFTIFCFQKINFRIAIKNIFESNLEIKFYISISIINKYFITLLLKHILNNEDNNNYFILMTLLNIQ